MRTTSSVLPIAHRSISSENDASCVGLDMEPLAGMSSCEWAMEKITPSQGKVAYHARPSCKALHRICIRSGKCTVNWRRISPQFWARTVHFRMTFIVAKYSILSSDSSSERSFFLCRLPELSIIAFDQVRRIDELAQLRGVLEKGRQFISVTPPRPDNQGIVFSPGHLKLNQF